MRLVFTILIVLFSWSAAAEGIKIFGTLVTFDRGEFVNPYESHEDSRGALSIVIDRECKSPECSGEVIIGPVKDPDNKKKDMHSLRKHLVLCCA